MTYGYQQSFEEKISNVTQTNSVQLGSRRVYDGDEYVYCYNAGGAQISPSYGVKLVTGATGYSVAVTSLTDTAHPCVGVVKHSTFAAADYGWCLVKGITNIEFDADSTATGDYMALSLSKDGTFHESVPLTDAVHAGTFAICAWGLNVDTASGGSGNAFIKTGF
jgi:hypothetical protein